MNISHNLNIINNNLKLEKIILFIIIVKLLINNQKNIINILRFNPYHINK